MKKFNLEMLRPTSDEVLERSQMKKITGGYGGSCGYRHPSGQVWCGMSSSQAQGAYANGGGNWCCGSCLSNGGSASYC
ncbi:hypothetical protein [Rhodonellum sp.]|uniref:hypothetical protein n=1 Tax=Rhodonellum sp. TaxID=2231180 RepID=UPI00271ECB15|nr:hypothetical protein [Rhodonellum sp.]MDO9553459.1 hypothetical protein [Rhodonellum sp.]